MKKYRLAAVLFAICLTVTACGSDSGDKVSTVDATAPVESQSPTPNPNMIIDPNNTASPTPEYVPVPESGYVFDITDDERIIYDELKKTLSTDVFEGVDPKSIAKIYIKSGVDLEWEAEYACYSQTGLSVTKDEWEKRHMADIERFDPRTRQEVANWYFPLIDEGEFIDNGDNTGYIAFHSVSDEYMTEEDTYAEFHLIKNDKGIWEVRYNPTLINPVEEDIEG